MSLYSELFYSKEINQLLSDKNQVSKMLLVEASLAQAQAECSLITKKTARTITKYCDINLIDLEKLKADAISGGNIAIPLVKQLIAIIKKKDPEAAKFVHMGATSQDIVDTATVLLMKEYSIWLTENIKSLKKELVTITKDNRNTVMIGRTLLQQATPITFGLKTALWLESMVRSEERLKQSINRLLVVQLSGSAGNGNNHITAKVQTAFAKKLNLKPSFSWHTNRDNIAEWAAVLSILNGSTGKMAKDIALLMQTEIAEVAEGKEDGKGGSSTMPHKRNPVTCATIIANAARTPHLTATILSTMQHEHERSAGGWHAEWEVLIQLMELTAGSIEKSIALIKGLEVNKERMLLNMEITKGLIYAETISFALTPKMGKEKAHELIEKACKISIKENKHLKEVLSDLKIDLPKLSDLFNPKNAADPSKEMVDAILKKQNSIHK